MNAPPGQTLHLRENSTGADPQAAATQAGLQCLATAFQSALIG